MASSLSEKKRKATLKKKASELSLLCGVEVLMVIVGSDGNMEVWPNDPAKAKSTIFNYYEAADKVNNKNLKLSESDQFPMKKKMKLQTDNTKLENLSSDSLVGLSDYLETTIQNLDKKIDDSLMMNKGKEIQVYNQDHEERVDGLWSDILKMLDLESEEPSFPFGYGVGNTSSCINGGDDGMDFGSKSCSEKSSESLMMKGKEIQHYNEDHEEERLDGFWFDMLKKLDQESEQLSFPFGCGFGNTSTSINGGDDWLGAVEADFGYSTNELGFESGNWCLGNDFDSNQTENFKIETSAKRQRL